MDDLGLDFNNTGSVMNRKQLEDLRRKRGECITCGRKCFRKKLFKMVPITQDGEVLEGRCLQCQPLKDNPPNSFPTPRKVTPQDLQRFAKSQSNLSSRTALLSPTSTTSQKSLSRTTNSLARSEGRSLGGSSTPATAPRVLAGRNPTSMFPLPGEDLPSLKQQPSRPIASLSMTGGGESRPLSVPLLPSRVPASPLIKPHSMPALTANGTGNCHRTDRNDQTSALTLNRNGPSNVNPGSQRKSNPAQAAGVQRGPPKQSTSGDLPTHEELQQAALTILAAKQHGLYNDVIATNSKTNGDELQTTSDHMESNADLHQTILDETPEDYEARVISTSYRSLMSVVSGDADANHSTDFENDFNLPQHGLLDRGGAVQLNPSTTNMRHTHNAGEHTTSKGSMSSISSLEDEVPPSTTPSRQSNGRNELRGAMEQYNQGRSGVSFRELRYRGNSRRGLSSRAISENEYLDKLQMARQNYREILLILHDAMEFVAIVRAALEELSHIPLTGPNHDGLAQLGGPKIVTDAMRHHESSLPVQIWGCGAVWNMSGIELTQLAFVEVGALHIILRAMDRFIDNVDLQEKSIAAIANLGAAFDNIAILKEKRAIARIVDAMNKHSTVINIQMKGCTAVTNLSSHDTPFKEELMKNGAGGTVIVAMVKHPDDPHLQEKALRALRYLCANNDVNQFELARVGGIDAVISAMQIHRDEASVQEEGAWTLSNLAGNDHNKAFIGDCGGVDVVIRAMWVHSDSVGVQEWCCRVLFTLTLDSQNGDVVLEIGGISAIVNAMQAHVDSSTVQEMGCAVLANLGGTDQSRMKIVDEEALDAIVLAMVLHTDDIQVQERACIILLQLAILPNFKSMKAANIPELVRVAAEKFPEQCQEPARRLLSAFTTVY